MIIDQPRLFDPAAIGFIERQTNGALRSFADLDMSIAILRHAVLPMHPDRPKNWDGLLAVQHALAQTQQGEAVLDAGAEVYSAFLPALASLGFEDLTGINLTMQGERDQGGILYRHGDITAAPFSAGRFAFIACLSVIEHGVDVAAFLHEQARLLRPGGHLFVSFDYWHQPIETHGQRAYGTPIKIFTPGDVAALLNHADAVGLHPTAPFNPECDEPVVHWQRFNLRYSFANLLLRRS